MTITASGFTVKATAFQGDGSGLTGVPANDWDGTHSGNGVITGNLEVQGNSSGSISSTGSWGKVVASKFFGNGQNIVGVTAEWDGSHTGTATFTGNVTASGVVSASGGFVGDGSNLTGVSSFAGTAGTETLFSGSAASTGSFGHIMKGGINWDTAVSTSAATAGFGTGGGGGGSSFAGAAGTETLFSGSAASTGSFAKIHIADAEFLSMDHAAVRGDDDIEFIGSTTTGSVAGMISGLQEDDLILYAYAGSSSVPSATQFASEGYTSLGATNNYDYYYGHVWYKKMGATPDASVPNNPFYWGDFIATAWRNVHPDDLWDASVQSYNGSNNRPNTPSITTVTAKAVVVSIGMCSNRNFTAGPSGYVGFVSSSASGFAYPGNIGVAYKEIATGASEDPGEFTSDVGNHLGYTIALKKYPAGTYTTNYGFSDIWNQHHKGTYTLVSGSSDSSFSGGTATFNTFAGDGSGLTNLDLSSLNGFNYTSGSSPVVTTNPSSLGATWINTTSGEIFVCHDITTGENNWLGTAGTEVVPAVPAYFGSRGLFGGGVDSSYAASNVIDYITIATTANASDFGDLTVAREGLAACSNGTRGIFGAGWANINTIDYVTIATTGNATDFGDLSVTRWGVGACSDGTKGVFGGGVIGSNSNVIDYVTIATTGNAIDFGDLSVARRQLAACSDGTKGLWGAGYVSSVSNVIDYVTIATTGNATDFGDITISRYYLGACSDGTKGLWGSGNTGSVSNVIDYVTIATTGNATDFGDLSVARFGAGACSDGTKGVFGGGSSSNVIDYVTIATTGNASDFGDLTFATSGLTACSGT